MSKKVSIIIPCYNIESYIEKCLKSIIDQTEKNIEIICVNDGSKDNTLAILQKYEQVDNRIRIINKKNGGVASARNVGIKEANGEYIMFVDGDDYIDENMVEQLYVNAKKNNIDIIKCNRYDVYPKSKKIIKRRPLWEENKIIEKDSFNEKIYMDFFKRAKLGVVWMTLIRNEIIKENDICFNEKMCVDEDVVFSFQVFLKAKRFMYLKDSYYYYVRHGEGLSARGVKLEKRIESRKEHIKFLKNVIKLCKIQNEEEVLKEKIAFVGVYTALQTSRMNKNITFFKRYNIFKSILTDDVFKMNIKTSQGKNLIITEKILLFLVKANLYRIAYLYGIICNLIIDTFRPIIEKIRN